MAPWCGVGRNQQRGHREVEQGQACDLVKNLHRDLCLDLAVVTKRVGNTRHA